MMLYIFVFEGIERVICVPTGKRVFKIASWYSMDMQNFIDIFGG